jgi:hypothetical protein
MPFLQLQAEPAPMKRPHGRKFVFALTIDTFLSRRGAIGNSLGCPPSAAPTLAPTLLRSHFAMRLSGASTLARELNLVEGQNARTATLSVPEPGLRAHSCS